MLNAENHWPEHAHEYSWVSMLDALTTRTPTLWSADHMMSHGGPSRREWTFGMSFDETVELVAGRRPWREAQDEIERIAREQAGKHLLKRPFYDLSYDVTGADFDMAAVLEGRPECWLAPAAANMGDPGVIRLVFDVSNSSTTDASLIRARMSAIGAAALTLEACGSPIELIAIHISSHPVPYCDAIRLNNAGEPIDTTRLAACAHPAFHRRATFRLLELTTSKRIADTCRSYGNVATLTPECVQDVWGARAVYIPGLCGVDVAPTCEALLALVKRRLGLVTAPGEDD